MPRRGCEVSVSSCGGRCWRKSRFSSSESSSRRCPCRSPSGIAEGIDQDWSSGTRTRTSPPDRQIVPDWKKHDRSDWICDSVQTAEVPAPYHRQPFERLQGFAENRDASRTLVFPESFSPTRRRINPRFLRCRFLSPRNPWIPLVERILGHRSHSWSRCHAVTNPFHLVFFGLPRVAAPCTLGGCPPLDRIQRQARGSATSSSRKPVEVIASSARRTRDPPQLCHCLSQGSRLDEARRAAARAAGRRGRRAFLDVDVVGADRPGRAGGGRTWPRRPRASRPHPGQCGKLTHRSLGTSSEAA